MNFNKRYEFLKNQAGPGWWHLAEPQFWVPGILLMLAAAAAFGLKLLINFTINCAVRQQRINFSLIWWIDVCVPVKIINNIPSSLLETLAVFLWIPLGFLMGDFFIFFLPSLACNKWWSSQWFLWEEIWEYRSDGSWWFFLCDNVYLSLITDIFNLLVFVHALFIPSVQNHCKIVLEHLFFCYSQCSFIINVWTALLWLF